MKSLSKYKNINNRIQIKGKKGISRANAQINNYKFLYNKDVDNLRHWYKKALYHKSCIKSVKDSALRSKSRKILSKMGRRGLEKFINGYK